MKMAMKSHVAPMDNEAADSVSTIGREWCRRSSAPELKCTTSPEVNLQTGWNQSEPSTRSEGKEATTGMSFRHMEKKPVLDGSDRRPEAREFRVRSPEFIAHSRESEELAALPLNTAETGRLQKVVEEDMEGEGKKCRCHVAWVTETVDLGGRITPRPTASDEHGMKMTHQIKQNLRR
ncbi:hypothetical protein B0H19DRAFT_1239191 [Mycena capillaripes]|nr:hypothetical protein B0H19DRAFT_1239191 [Mycena capillaripes]